MKKANFILLTLCSIILYSCGDDNNDTSKFEINVDNNEITFDYQGDAVSINTFSITSNVKWRLSKTDDWVTMDKAEGENNAKVTITTSANLSNTSRSTTLTLSSIDNPANSISIIIKQKGVDPGFDILSKIEDEEFRKYCDRFDFNKDGKISIDEANQVNDIVLRTFYSNIKSLSGIEYFPNLTNLHCSDLLITSLDISKNIKLTRIIFWDNNGLKSVDLGKNTELRYVELVQTSFSSLDLTNNNKLDSIRCEDNKSLSDLKLGHKPNLTYIYIYIYCQENSISNIDLSLCTALEDLHLYNTKLTNLDLTQNTRLKAISCQSNQLTNIDLTKNVELKHLSYGYNQTKSLDLSKNSKLENLYFTETLVTDIELTSNPKLKTLICSNNKLTKLSLTNNPELEDLKCYDNQIVSIDISKNTLLKRLECNKNWIESLDLSNNPNLSTLICNNNHLSLIDISQNEKLRYLHCKENPELKTIYVWKGFNTQDPNQSIILHRDPQTECIIK